MASYSTAPGSRRKPKRKKSPNGKSPNGKKAQTAAQTGQKRSPNGGAQTGRESPNGDTQLSEPFEENKSPNGEAQTGTPNFLSPLKKKQAIAFVYIRPKRGYGPKPKRGHPTFRQPKRARSEAVTLVEKAQTGPNGETGAQTGPKRGPNGDTQLSEPFEEKAGDRVRLYTGISNAVD